MGELLFRPVRGGVPVALVVAGVAWMHCTRVGCYWRRVGCTLGRWGLRAVGTTLGQWIPTLVEQAYSRRDSKRNLRPTMTTGTLCRQRAGSGGGGPMTEASGCAVGTPDSLLRGLVSTVLTLTGPASMFPAGIVEILRSFFGVQHRCGANVSAVDTDAPPDLFPSSCPRFQGHRPAQGSCPSGCLRSHDTQMSQK